MTSDGSKTSIIATAFLSFSTLGLITLSILLAFLAKEFYFHEVLKSYNNANVICMYLAALLSILSSLFVILSLFLGVSHNKCLSVMNGLFYFVLVITLCGAGIFFRFSADTIIESIFQPCLNNTSPQYYMDQLYD